MSVKGFNWMISHIKRFHKWNHLIHTKFTSSTHIRVYAVVQPQSKDSKLEFSSKRRTKFVLHFFGGQRTNPLCFLRVSNFYIRSTCKFNPLRFNHERGVAGRHASAALDARAQKRTPPCGGFGRGPTITGVETPQNFNILLRRSEDNSAGRVWFKSKNMKLLKQVWTQIGNIELGYLNRK